MSEENSKLMSGVGSHGLKASLTLKVEMSAREIRERLEEMIMSIARRVSGDGERTIGHIKVFVRMGGGYLKASVVDLDLGVESINALEEGEMKGEMNLMAAVFGLGDHEIEEILEEELERSDVIIFNIEHHHHKHGRKLEVE